MNRFVITLSAHPHTHAVLLFSMISILHFRYMHRSYGFEYMRFYFDFFSIFFDTEPLPPV